MRFSKTELEEFNSKLREDAKNLELNYAEFITPQDADKVTVVCTHVKRAEDERFYGLDKDLNVEEKKYEEGFVYGISPRISADEIIDAISCLAFTDNEGLSDFVKRYHDCFAFHKEQKEFIPALAKYIALSLTYNYCLKFRFEKQPFDTRKYPLQTEYDEISRILTVTGCPSDEMIRELSRFRYRIKDGEYVAEAAEDGDLDVKDVYGARRLIRLHNSDVFYSGVLLRPLEIVEESADECNKGVKSLNIIFEKSSYGTVYAFDSSAALCHSALKKEEKDAVRIFFGNEDAAVRELAENGEILCKVNNYLKKSYNVHQICVSANIETSDGYLLFPVRGRKSIDASKNPKKPLIYPSVNGNAEVLDNDVKFYKVSAIEDLPKIEIEEGQRIDFNAELTREAYSELHLYFEPMLWEIYGISVGGRILGENDVFDGVKRRLHFNVLAKQRCQYDFDEVCKTEALATESYEIDRLKGVKVNTYKNKCNRVMSALKTFFKKVIENSEVLMALLTVLIFCTVTDFENIDLSAVKEFLSAFFGAILIALFVVNVVKKIAEYRVKRKKVTVFGEIATEKGENHCRITEKLLNDYTFHPATFTLVKLYFLSKLRADEKRGRNEKTS